MGVREGKRGERERGEVKLPMEDEPELCLKGLEGIGWRSPESGAGIPGETKKNKEMRGCCRRIKIKRPSLSSPIWKLNF